jgi:7-cyano-7-deazaguanine synthase
MKNTLESKCLVVLSGGQDSTTCLFWAKENYDVVHAVTFDYGQRHRIEIEAAKRVASMAGVASHEIIEIPNILKSTSPLVSGTPLEQYSDPEQMAQVIGGRVELTFVPLRNTMFLTIAANRAVALGAYDIITGICQEDNANYPDCTESFRVDYEYALNSSLGTRFGTYKVVAPLMFKSKAESALLAHDLPGCWEALAYSHTSYDGKYPPTDMNHSNVLRADGFHKAGLPDPLVIRAWKEGLMDLPGTKNYDAFRA